MLIIIIIINIIFLTLTHIITRRQSAQHIILLAVARVNVGFRDKK